MPPLKRQGLSGPNFVEKNKAPQTAKCVQIQYLQRKQIEQRALQVARKRVIDEDQRKYKLFLSVKP